MYDYETDQGYDRLTPAWVLLMGPNLHYGYFDTPDDDLKTATNRLTQVMATHADLDTGTHVLDVGCGVGAPACFLAEKVGCLVTGITTGKGGLAKARRLSEARGLSDRAKVQHGDGMDNGLPDTSFDRVWIMQASHLMLYKDRLITECARVLRPGGRLVLCDIIQSRPMSTREMLEHRHDFLLLHRVFGRAKIEPLQLYESLAEDNGLSVLVKRDISRETMPTFDKWRLNASKHRTETVKMLGEKIWRDFVGSCDVLEKLWRVGTLGYGLFTADKPSSTEE